MPEYHRYIPMYGYGPMQGAGGSGGGGAAAYSVVAADFDGATDYIQWNPTILFANSNTFSTVFVLKRDTGNLGTQQLINDNQGNRAQLRFDADNTLHIQLKDTANAFIVTLNVTETFTSSDTIVLLVSVDNTINGSEVLNIYNGDTALTFTPVWTSNVVINLARARTTIGAIPLIPPTSLFFHGCIGPVLQTTEYIDWSVEANRRNVIDASGNLQNPSSDGSGWSPTSQVPEIFIEDTYNASGTNGGSGANPDTSLTIPDLCT